ncbi:MAG: hypothetical protein K9M94_13985 [Spirochaetia bacterium]|nr:hypothetical protein [Spirochaetia bacterium]
MPVLPGLFVLSVLPGLGLYGVWTGIFMGSKLRGRIDFTESVPPHPRGHLYVQGSSAPRLDKLACVSLTALGPAPDL